MIFYSKYFFPESKEVVSSSSIKILDKSEAIDTKGDWCIFVFSLNKSINQLHFLEPLITCLFWLLLDLFPLYLTLLFLCPPRNIKIVFNGIWNCSVTSYQSCSVSAPITPKVVERGVFLDSYKDIRTFHNHTYLP